MTVIVVAPGEGVSLGLGVVEGAWEEPAHGPCLYHEVRGRPSPASVGGKSEEEKKV